MSNDPETPARARRALFLIVGFLLGVGFAIPVTIGLAPRSAGPPPAGDATADRAEATAERLELAIEKQSQQLSDEIAASTAATSAEFDKNDLALAKLNDQTRSQQAVINQLRADLELVVRMVALENRAQYQVHIDAGIKHHLAGSYHEAVEEFSDALAIRPDALRAFLNRGMAHQELGNWQKALADFQAAQRLDPKNYAPLNNIGWLLATCPDESIRDGELAILAARQACDLSEWKNYSALSTLAAAAAESGDFEEAANRIREAEALAPDEAKTGLAADLELYEAKKPQRMDVDATATTP